MGGLIGSVTIRYAARCVQKQKTLKNQKRANGAFSAFLFSTLLPFQISHNKDR
jgi:hypothetical protein